VVAFGDSISDGFHSTVGADHRWPDYLAGRLAAEPGGSRLGVADAGIGGNRVLTNALLPYQGISGLSRFATDALGQPDVKDVILLEGINDISAGVTSRGRPLTAQDLIEGYRTLIAQAHAAGVRIIGGTVLPHNGISSNDNAIRTTVNNWIRSSHAFDGFVDFDAAMRNPYAPSRLNPTYDSGDGLHPNDLGMKVMADAVDLTLLHA
jgi:lysophospholipase L1-like esterase